MKDIRKLGILIVLSLLVLVGVGSIFYSLYRLRNNPEFLSDKPVQEEVNQNAQGQKISLIETKAGKRKWVINLKKIKYNRDNNKAHMVGVTGTVYGDKQKVLFTFKSPTGIYEKLKGHIQLTDGAEMTSPEAKITLKANRMDWSSARDEVIASEGVEMRKEGFGFSRAKSAVFSMDFSEIRFQGGTVAEFGGAAKNPSAPSPL